VAASSSEPAYLVALYGLDLDLTRSRTVATGIVVVCGLAVVMRLEAGEGAMRGQPTDAGKACQSALSSQLSERLCL
jgi:hypothetical protein